MAIAQAVTCDVCGKLKGEVNCWWLQTRAKAFFEVMPWNDETYATSDHLCGQECVVKALNKFMQDQAA